MNLQYKTLPYINRRVYGDGFVPRKKYPAIEVLSLGDAKITELHDFLKNTIGYNNIAFQDMWVFFAYEEDATAFAIKFG